MPEETAQIDPGEQHLAQSTQPKLEKKVEPIVFPSEEIEEEKTFSSRTEASYYYFQSVANFIKQCDETIPEAEIVIKRGRIFNGFCDNQQFHVFDPFAKGLIQDNYIPREITQDTLDVFVTEYACQLVPDAEFRFPWYNAKIEGTTNSVFSVIKSQLITYLTSHFTDFAFRRDDGGNLIPNNLPQRLN